MQKPREEAQILENLAALGGLAGIDLHPPHMGAREWRD